MMKLLSTYSPPSGVTNFTLSSIDTAAEYSTIVIFAQLEMNPGTGLANHIYLQPNATGSQYSSGYTSYATSTFGWVAAYQTGIICYYAQAGIGGSYLGKTNMIITIGNRGSGENSHIMVRYGNSNYGPSTSTNDKSPGSGSAACGMLDTTLITSLAFNLSYAVTNASKIEIYGA